MRTYKFLISLVVLSVSTSFLVLNSCSREYSSTTGWEYNRPENGWFEVVPYQEQITGPGLVFIEG